jgi:PTS system mannose-specific IID component
MATVTGRVGRFDLFKVFLRLLFLGGLLNRKGMQNLGLVAALSEVGGKLGSAQGNSLLVKHLSFFNCNPNFVPLIVGGIIKLEEERLEGKPVTDEDIEFFKKSMGSPLAAMGDLLFLGSLKPLALTFACIFAIYKIPIGLLAIFLLYNLSIISCRFWGLYFGYAKGWELVDVFSGPEFQRVLGILQGLGAGVGGVLVGIIFNRFPQSGQWTLVAGGILTVVTLYFLRKDVPASWLAVALFPVFALVTFLMG